MIQTLKLEKLKLKEKQSVACKLEQAKDHHKSISENDISIKRDLIHDVLKYFSSQTCPTHIEFRIDNLVNFLQRYPGDYPFCHLQGSDFQNAFLAFINQKKDEGLEPILRFYLGQITAFSQMKTVDLNPAQAPEKSTDFQPSLKQAIGAALKKRLHWIRAASSENRPRKF